MKVISKLNGIELNNVVLNKVEPLEDLNIPEAAIETLFESYLMKCGWGNINILYTKRIAKNEAFDTFPSKTGDGKGAPDYILYEKAEYDSAIIAVGDVKRPKNSSSIEGLNDAIFYANGYNEFHEHKIRIAFGFDGVDFIIKYLTDIKNNIWEDIFIDDNVLQELPSPDFMMLINDTNNYFVTNKKKNIAKEMLEPFFAKCDRILRHTKLSSSPIDKSIEISIFIFLNIFSRKGLDKGFKDISSGKSVWELVEDGNIPIINSLFINYLNETYSNVFPDKLISVEKDDAIKLAEIINIMFRSYNIHELTDVKGNALEYFQKDSKDKKIGEFFTPRHIVDLIIYLVNPQITFKTKDSDYLLDENGNRIIEKVEKIYDPACGSGGFLIQSFNRYLDKYGKYGVTSEKLKTDVIFGTELKEKTVILTKLNMILLGDGHNNIVRNSSISYILLEKLIRIKKNNKYVEVNADDVERISKVTKFGKIYTYVKKDTHEPVVKVINKVKYYLAQKDNKTGQLRKIKVNNKYVPISDSQVIEQEAIEDGIKKTYYYRNGSNEPVIRQGNETTKYYLAKIKVNKDNIPEKEYVSVKAVNDAVREEHSPNFGKFDIVMANHPYGLEEPNKPDELFVKHMLESLRNGGRIGCVVGENILFDNTYLKFRKQLQNNYTVESIISLPQGVFWPYTDVKTSILLLKKQKPPKGHKTWLVEITSDGFELTPSRIPVKDNDIPKLKNLWRAWGGKTLEIDDNEVYESYHREEKGFAEFHELVSSNWCVKRYNTPKISLCSKYDLVPLMDILERKKDSITLKDDEKYKRITIQVQNRGVILRDEEYGCNIGTKTQFKINEGQLVISKIDARNGAYGIVPGELDGAIITNNFWAFDINTTKIYPEYLTYLMLNEYFLNICETCSYGSTNRWYLDEDTFNNYKIPLPDKNTQKIILTRIKKENDEIKKAQEVINNAKISIRNIINELFR
ncbi:N-6 DNA methylase [Clostridium novyi]|uniref:N-6 DNA methylase n=1 Tax=Clostridium novyi TaxID=1542 RepID=UPI00069D9E3F|nr:N-6 DNA methylase [Clostridium novyi]